MNEPTTIPANRPHYMNEEMYRRLWAMFDSGADLDAIADTIYREFPADLDKRSAGLAVVWFEKHLNEVTA